MSAPTLSAPTDATGWQLEITGTGDKIQYRAADKDDRGIAVVSRLSFGPWMLVSLTSFCGEHALPPLMFDNDVDAVAWLTYLANCYTWPGGERVTGEPVGGVRLGGDSGVQTVRPSERRVTPRHPWRRRVRDELIPILWLLATAVLIGVALGQCIAQAEPASPGQAFADEHAADICLALDSWPTVTGVWTLLADLTTTGLSGVESGVAVKESVVYVCPHHLSLLHRFVTYYQQRQSGVTT